MKLSSFLILFFISANVSAVQTGPLIDPLYPKKIYHDPGNGLYLEFSAGSMPGCSHGLGGRLSRENPNYKELYSLLLTMAATKNFQGQIRYKETAHNGWWKCSIEGIWVLTK